MNNNLSSKRQFSRRDFLKMAGGAACIVAGASVMPQFLRKTLLPESVVNAANDYDVFYAGTDGWIHLPDDQPIGFYFPDDLAPTNFNTYIFGFRNITGLDAAQIGQQKMKAQHNAPLFWVNQYDPNLIDPLTGAPKEFRLQLTNLGLAVRPDLTDSHTVRGGVREDG